MDHEIKKSMVMTVLVMMGSPRDSRPNPQRQGSAVSSNSFTKGSRLSSGIHVMPDCLMITTSGPGRMTQKKSDISTSKSIGFYWHLFTTTNIENIRLDVESGDQEFPASRSDASMFFPEASVTSSSPLRANLMVAS